MYKLLMSAESEDQLIKIVKGERNGFGYSFAFYQQDIKYVCSGVFAAKEINAACAVRDHGDSGPLRFCNALA